MSFFLLFFVLGQWERFLSGQWISSSSILNVYSYEMGVFYPSFGSGLTGSFLNPANLSRIPAKREIFVGFTPTRTFSTYFDLNLLSPEQISIDLTIPTEISTRHRGGFDLIGISQKLGKFMFGFGIWNQEVEEFKIEGDFLIGSSVSFDSFYYPIHTETGEVPLYWNLTIFGHANGSLRGSIKHVKNPIFFRAATTFGFLSLGLGLDWEKSRLVLSSEGFAFVMADSLLALTTYDTAGRLIHIVGNFTTSFRDTVFLARGSSSATLNRFGPSLGANINLGLLKLGLSIKSYFPSTINIKEPSFELITTEGLPETLIYSPRIRFSNDTLNLRDTLIFSNTHKSSQRWVYSITDIKTKSGISYGFGISLLILHLGGNLDIIPAQDGSKIYYYNLGTGIVIPIIFGKAGMGLGLNGGLIEDKIRHIVPLYQRVSLNMGATISPLIDLNIGVGMKFIPNFYLIKSLTPLREAENVKTPSIFESLVFSFGLSKLWF